MEVSDLLAVFCKDKRAQEACTALVLIGHFGDEALVVFGMVSFFSAKAGRPDTGGPAKRVDLKPRVIGEHPTVDETTDSQRFQSGIFEKGASRLLDLWKFGK